MADHNALHGSCACSRNQYTVLIPPLSASYAQVYFSNSAANRRSQATPLTAWLRIPLSWYHSSTHAHFPDETHATIRRTFDTPAPHAELPPTRRVFCGYCGTHLSAWTEGREGRGEEVVDVTLGSLEGESLDLLEGLGVVGGSSEEEEEDDEGEGFGNEEEEEVDVRREPEVMDEETAAAVRRRSQHSMRDRGVPYFEEMVENSRLGRIKRQKGGHTSADGRTTVQWEVIEIGGDDGVASSTLDTSTEDQVGGRSKRQRLGV